MYNLYSPRYVCLGVCAIIKAVKGKARIIQGGLSYEMCGTS